MHSTALPKRVSVELRWFFDGNLIESAISQRPRSTVFLSPSSPLSPPTALTRFLFRFASVWLLLVIFSLGYWMSSPCVSNTEGTSAVDAAMKGITSFEATILNFSFNAQIRRCPFVLCQLTDHFSFDYDAFYFVLYSNTAFRYFELILIIADMIKLWLRLANNKIMKT